MSKLQIIDHLHDLMVIDNVMHSSGGAHIDALSVTFFCTSIARIMTIK